MKYYTYATGDYSTAQIKAFIDDMRAENMDYHNLLKLRPDAADNPPSFITSLTPDEVARITPDAFAGTIGESLALALSMRQMEGIGVDGKRDLKIAIILALARANNKQASNDIRQKAAYIQTSPLWQI